MIDMLEQPEYIAIHSSLRLRKYDGQVHLAFSWYQNPDVIRLIDGSREPYTLQRIKKMYDYLTQHGEVYFIEILINENWMPIGDVSFWQEDMPILLVTQIIVVMESGRLLFKH